MSAGLPYSVLLQLEFLECPASLQLPCSPCCSLHTFPLVYTSWTPLSGAAASSVTALGGFLEVPIASSRVSVFLICAPEGSKGVHMFFRHPGTKSIHGWSRENPNCGILAVGEVVEAHRAALAQLGKVVRVPGRYCAISICSACALSTRSARLAYPPTHTHTYTSHTRPLSIPYPSRLSKFHRGAVDWGPSSITVRPTRGGGVCIYPTHTILSSFPFGIFQFAWPPQLDLSAGPDSQRLSSSCTLSFVRSHAQAPGQIRPPAISLCLTCRCMLTSRYSFLFMIHFATAIYIWGTLMAMWAPLHALSTASSALADYFRNITVC